MKAVTIDERRIAARIALVDEHAQAEMDCDLDRTLATLNEAPDYKMNNDEFSGRESVRAFYANLYTGFPDLHIEITRRYVSDEAIIVEVTFSGTHKNQWSGIPATGRRVQFPFCAIFPFDENDRLAGSGLILTARSC
jgi:predicted ester cyclase